MDAIQALAKTKKLAPQTRVDVSKGVTLRRTSGGIPVMRLHYSAIPERDPEEHPEWKKSERRLYTSEAAWQREQEIVDEAGGGELVFAETLITHWNKIVISDPAWRPDPRWRVEAGFDHGKTNPTAFERAYLDHEGTIILCGEYYMPGMEIWQHAPVLKTMEDIRKVAACYADPSIFPLTLQQSQQGNRPGQAAERAKSINELYVEHGIELFSPFAGDRSDVSFAARVMQHWSNLDKREPSLKIVCRNSSERPQPGLHNWDCPNLLWEMMRTRRVKLTAQQLLSRNTAEAIVDKDNHAADACFVAGTMITTRRGQVAIENLAESDEVMTRLGWRRVLRTWMTSHCAEILRVRFSGGRVLEVTPNHLIYSSGEFYRADELKYGMLCSCLENTAHLKSSTGWALTSTDTHIARTAISADILGTAASTCTRLSGYLLMANRFLRSITSTILTETRSTILPRTLMPCLAPFTSDFSVGAESIPPNLLPWLRGEGERGRGIHRQRDERGTHSMVAGNYIRRFKRIAVIAGRSLLTGISARKVIRSAPQRAAPDGATPIALTTKSAGASTALSHSLATDTTKLDFVPGSARVLSVEKIPVQLPVYNVEVEGEPEYFANGILVHNCKYLVMSHPEPTVKTMREIAAEAIAPMVQQGDLTSAAIRYQIMMSEEEEQYQPATLGRRRRR